VLHENMTDSIIIKEKFPNGVSGTPLGAPAKGLYCLGFWRGLPPDIVGALRVRVAGQRVASRARDARVRCALRVLCALHVLLPVLLAPECESLRVRSARGGATAQAMQRRDRAAVPRRAAMTRAACVGCARACRLEQR
jgi:hypothetical protein